jgi:hypothetical protein
VAFMPRFAPLVVLMFLGTAPASRLSAAGYFAARARALAKALRSTRVAAGVRL